MSDVDSESSFELLSAQLQRERGFHWFHMTTMNRMEAFAKECVRLDKRVTWSCDQTTGLPIVAVDPNEATPQERAGRRRQHDRRPSCNAAAGAEFRLPFMTILQRWKQTALHNKIIIILMAIGTGIAAWPLLHHTTTPTTQHSDGPFSPNIVDNNGNITIHGDIIPLQKREGFFDAQCESKQFTTTPSPGESIKVLQEWPLPINGVNGGGGLAEMFVTKDEFILPKPKPEEAFPLLEGYECKITNYMTDPVFNVRIELQEEFMESIRDPQSNAMHPGKITRTLGWPINIRKIDAGISNAFVFYLFNTSDNVLDVSIPDAVTLTMADNTVRKVRLLHSEPMLFWPQSEP